MSRLGYYGNRILNRFRKGAVPQGGTIHQTGHLDIETHDGKVIAVWFRCRTLPFQQHETGYQRFSDLKQMGQPSIQITGINFEDVDATPDV